VAAGGGGSTYVRAEDAGMVQVGREDVVLRVRLGAILSGRLVDPRGKPVRTIGLHATSQDGDLTGWASERVDDAEGRFTLTGLRAGAQRLWLYRGSSRVDLAEATAPGTDVVITVPDP
jgi:hypothetical protein